MEQVQAEVDLAALRTIIEQLQLALPQVRSVLVTRSDGLPLVKTASQVDAAKVAAMAATSISLNKRIISTMDAGDLTETSISGSQGQILLYAAGPRAVLALTAQSRANVAMINFKARPAARAIADAFVLASPSSARGENSASP